MSDYYMWLLSKVDSGRGEASTYSNLLDLLFSTTYRYVFVMDSNRAKAGENLRSVYAFNNGLYLEDVYEGPCTVLEMLIALSEHLSFDTNEEISDWFWRLVGNLGLDVFDDEYFDENYILARLDSWMDRDFDYDGNGSIFPLNNPSCDQRTVEVWNQMNAYLMENYPVGNWID